MRIGVIYELICPLSKKCRYIGKTIQKPKDRLGKHLKINENCNNYKTNWLKKLKKLDLLQEVKINIIEKVEEHLLNDREIYWIAEYRKLGYKLTNTTPGGECGSLNYKHTDEAKRKISERSKKQKGIKRSQKFKDKISKSLKGKKGRNTGNKHSDETKEKISKSKKGKVSWNAKTIIQLDKNDNFIKEWRSAHDAAKSLNLSQGNIHGVITGNRKTCGGFKWKLK